MTNGQHGRQRLPPCFPLVLENPTMSLKQEMQELIEWVYMRAEEMDYKPDHSDDHHYVLFHETAKHFALYKPDLTAPTWLSRVVDGVLRDRAEGVTADDY